jgi:hypothetical protein
LRAHSVRISLRFSKGNAQRMGTTNGLDKYEWNLFVHGHGRNDNNNHIQ